MITLQIVNYNSRENLHSCLNSIEKANLADEELQIILVNNDKKPLAVDEIKENANLSIEIVEAGENLGFGKAHNLGIKKAQGDFVLFLNPDTKISENAILELVGTLKNNQVGITGPLLVDENGIVEEEHWGTKKTPFSIMAAKFAGRKTVILDGIAEAEWLSGGAMMVRKKLFLELGGFDENFFMYYEDVDLCLRARRKNIKIVVNPQARVVHSGGRSYEDNKEKKRHYYTSQDYYLRKNFGCIPAFLIKIIRLPLYLKNVYFEQ